MKVKKFTFKMNRPTGKWKCFSSTSCDILLEKNLVGSFYEDKSTANTIIEIRFMKMKADIMEDGNSNCLWKWTTLNKKCASFDEAKTWVNENFEIINTSINLRKY